MDRRWIIIGIIIVSILTGTVAIFALGSNKTGTLEDVFPEAPSMEHSSAMDVTDKVAVQVVFDDADELLDYMAQEDQLIVVEQLNQLFGHYFPHLVEMTVDPKRYYSEYEEEVLEKMNVNIPEDFVNLYNKLLRIPNHKICRLILVPDTYSKSDENHLFNLLATYDGITEVEFYVAVDRETLKLTIY